MTVFPQGIVYPKNVAILGMKLKNQITFIKIIFLDITIEFLSLQNNFYKKELAFETLLYILDIYSNDNIGNWRMEMLFNLTEFSDEPLHGQISRQIMDKIVFGELAAGHVLESIGALASSHHVSKRTVKRAYDDLQKEGLIKYGSRGNYKITNLSAQQKRDLRVQQRLARTGTTESRQLLNELELAQQMLIDLLPNILPNNERYSLAAFTSPSKTVGGDFYDYIPIEDDRFGVVIADVCGDGLPAAILAAQIQAMIKSGLNLCQGVQVTLEFLNNQTKNFIPRNKFATLFFGTFDNRNNKFIYSSAGHNYPILVRNDGSTGFLQAGGPALGFANDTKYATGEVILNEGDTIFFYTDGVTETMNSNRNEFGEERLRKLLSSLCNFTPDEMIDSVIEKLNQFQGIAVEQDDRTMMIFKLNKQAS